MANSYTNLPKAKSILITGANGLIANALIEFLLKNSSYQIYAFSTHLGIAQKKYQTLLNQYPNFKLIDFKTTILNLDIIINLAGESIAKKYLNKKRLKFINDSRLEFIYKLYNYIRSQNLYPRLFIQASATDIYAKSQDIISDLNPNHKLNLNPLGTIAHNQEQTVYKLFNPLKCQVSICRFPLVIAPNAILVKGLRFGIAPYFIGNQSILPYIALLDLVRALHLIIDQEITGIINCVNPNFLHTNELLHAIKGKSFLIPCFLPLIAKLDPRLSIFSSDLKIKADKLLSYGFKFKINNESDLKKYLQK